VNAAAIAVSAARAWHDGTDVAVGCLVEVEDDGSVVARTLSLAGVPIDPGRLHARGDRLGGQHEVDAHPEVLVEHPRAVVPVGEHALVGPAVADDVPEPHRQQIRERLAFWRRDVGLADVGAWVEDVLVRRRHVEVAAHERAVGVGGDHLPERRQPCELVLVVVAAGGAAVGDVDRRDADPAAGRPHRACLLVRESGAVRDPAGDVVEPGPREDRHAVPGGLAVRGDLVAAGRQLAIQQGRERVIGELRLL
jgi:hypothetical protein